MATLQAKEPDVPCVARQPGRVEWEVVVVVPPAIVRGLNGGHQILGLYGDIPNPKCSTYLLLKQIKISKYIYMCLCIYIDKETTQTRLLHCGFWNYGTMSTI